MPGYPLLLPTVAIYRPAQDPRYYVSGNVDQERNQKLHCV